MKKNFKKILILVLFISILYNANAQDENVTINVYNWGEYISNGSDGNLNVNAEFTKETGINVNYTTFQTNEEMFAKLSGGSAIYDVIIPSDYMISKLIENDMLCKLDFENIPNYKFIDNNFRGLEYDPQNEYTVPYTWGLVGIYYNKKYVDEKEETIDWDILWNKKYSGKILMFDSARDAFGIALLKLGKSMNSTNADDWNKAYEELLRQKPLVQSYTMDQTLDKMSNSEAVLAPYYSGDAALIIKSNPDVGFVIPKSGTVKFVDSMCIPKSSEHKEEAEKYINFMCRTDIALENILYIGYSSAQKEVIDILRQDNNYNKFSYPDEDIIKNSKIFLNLSPEINNLLHSLWIEVKIGTDSSWALFLAIILGSVVLYILVYVYKKRRNKLFYK
ncbi:MAG: spermidine/putrescine ABC transporter substrate-binding protein [Oscillospiraceae bacterium]|nr:spermidine/putrescine ABC transporter substrate-binding protein [Oscillospiraceae bacterium]